MKLAIMQPYLFPYIGYFQLINAVDKFVVYDDVTFIKSGWVNRNRILVNNMEYLFTIPLTNASSHILIKDIQISTNQKWANKLLKTMEQSYKKAPYFEETFPLILKVINMKTKFIRDMNLKCFQLINAYIGIETLIKETSTQYKNNNMARQERVIDICLVEKTQKYINAINGKELYDENFFLQNGLEILFIKPKKVKYSQYNNKFIPWLSIIDIMMFNPPSMIKKMLNQYNLE